MFTSIKNLLHNINAAHSELRNISFLLPGFSQNRNLCFYFKVSTQNNFIILVMNGAEISQGIWGKSVELI